MGVIYLDACLLIYLVEDRQGQGAAVADRMRSSIGDKFAISGLVRLECLVKPLRDGDVLMQRRYESVLNNFIVLPIDLSGFDLAANLRARFGLRTPDALHLACAQSHQCKAFWTNDQRLHRASHGLSQAIEG